MSYACRLKIAQVLSREDFGSEKGFILELESLEDQRNESLQFILDEPLRCFAGIKKRNSTSN
jgi:hypothetical protein